MAGDRVAGMAGAGRTSARLWRSLFCACLAWGLAALPEPRRWWSRGRTSARGARGGARGERADAGSGGGASGSFTVFASDPDDRGTDAGCSAQDVSIA
jgi:hypothetical protein